MHLDRRTNTNRSLHDAQNTTLCELCRQPTAYTQQRKVQGYSSRGRVILCCQCAESFVEYLEEFVHPKYPVA
jgi:hypothetical protein